MRWTLEVGCVSITLNGPALWVWPFAQAWSRWSGEASDYELRLEQDRGLPEPRAFLFTTLPRFNDGRCVLEAPGFAGEIVPEEKRACLRAHPASSIGDLAYFIRTVFAIWAFDQGAVLFHAAGVIHRGKAWAFFGPSGSGKTTIVRLSEGKEILSDDLLLLRRKAKGWEAWATPFSLYRSERLSTPLHVLMRLVKAQGDYVEPLRPSVALGELIASSPVVNADPSRLPALLARWEQILTSVPVCSLCFRKSNAFWEVIDAAFG
ncbi:MAG: hypothetical protein DRI61_03625 [Chloroflexi bacterium]|nr:MAG: hypothetical protein DRI61_03625 [Chloroflexota bacterium]